MSGIVILLVIGIFIWLFMKSSGGKFTSIRSNLKLEDVLYSEYGYITALVAKLAKSDGHVSELEQEFILNIVDDICDAFDDRDLAHEYIKEIFHEEQDVQDNVHEVATRLYEATKHERFKHEKILEFLVNLAFIDGEFHAKERKTLEEITDALHLDPGILLRFIDNFESFYTNRKAQSGSMSLSSAYALLGVDEESVDAAMLKKAYRKQVKLHHPDIVSGQGGSAEDIQAATQRLQDINEAYELIKKERNY